MNRIVFDSPVGRISVTEEAGALTRLGWGDGGALGEESPLLTEARRQLSEYFAGTRHSFDLPLRVEASPLQRAVCDAMLAIPYGDTSTYGAISKQVGASAQAVGQACGANPIAILIPCHRVLGADTLGGYSGAGGVETKVALLRLEGAAGLLI